jgi:hypothetical protein
MRKILIAASKSPGDFRPKGNKKIVMVATVFAAALMTGAAGAASSTWTWLSHASCASLLDKGVPAQVKNDPCLSGWLGAQFHYNNRENADIFETVVNGC